MELRQICDNCKHCKGIKDNSVYRRPYDGHCALSGDLVFGDDTCDEWSFNGHWCTRCVHCIDPDGDSPSCVVHRYDGETDIKNANGCRMYIKRI